MRIARSVLFRTKRAARIAACYGLRRVVNFDPYENLYLFSEPRGGSTWLSEMVSLVPKTAVLWEPLHLDHAPLFRDLGFSWRQRIEEGASWDAARDAFERTFRGRTLNDWSCGSSYRDYLRADRLVVKLCRANGMLPWLTQTFDFRFAPVYLVRHPFAVAASQMKWGSWDYDFQGFNAAEFEPGSWRARHADFLATLTKKHEALVLSWCQANADTLRNPRNGSDWITVHYEHLLLAPEAELTRVFERWGLPMPDAVVQQAREASAMTKEATFEHGVDAQLAKWKSAFSDDEVGDMLRVLRYFGVEAYSADTRPHRTSSVAASSQALER